MPYYTEQQIEQANSKSLVDFLWRQGEHLKKIGGQYKWEKHHVWIDNNRWYTHYDAQGGYAVSFVMKYYSLKFYDAVAELLGDKITTDKDVPAKVPKTKELVIPKANANMNRVYAYLMKERCISREVITFFAHNKTLYEDEQYHNCIFVGVDEEGQPQHIHRRGTMGALKLTAPGSKAEYSFHYDGKSECMFVFEGPIDMLAFITLNQEEWTEHSYVALCSVSERPLLHRLKVNDHIKKVVLCLDNDNAGIAACVRIKETLMRSGFTDIVELFPNNKDWAEDVKSINGIGYVEAEVDETETIRSLCKKYLLDAKFTHKPPQLYYKMFEVFTGIKNMMPNIKKERFDNLIVLLLLLSKDECRKSLYDISWDEIYELLIQKYVPHTDNGNTDIRMRQIMLDMNEVSKVYDTPYMLIDIEIFTNPILKLTMDCIRLINYLY